MRKRFLFVILTIFLFAHNVFGIEEIVPDFSDENDTSFDLREKESETFTQKLFSQKSINFGNDFVNKMEYGANFRGFLDMTHYDESNTLGTSYPFLIEPYVHLYSKDEKNQFRATFLPTNDTTNFEHKFLATVNTVYFARKINDNNRILIGNARTPVGFEGGGSTYDLKFANRSQIAQNFGNAKALGIRLQGNVKMFDYDIGVHSSTRKLQHLNDGGEFTGWISYKPFYNKENAFKNLKIGTGLNYGRRGENYTVLSSGIMWDYKKWYASAEYGYAHNYNGYDGFRRGKAQGGNATLGYNITDKVEIVGRYDIFNGNIDGGGKYITQYSAGLSYYAIQKRLKFMLNYVFEQQKHNNQNKVIFLTQFMI